MHCLFVFLVREIRFYLAVLDIQVFLYGFRSSLREAALKENVSIVFIDLLVRSHEIENPSLRVEIDLNVAVIPLAIKLDEIPIVYSTTGYPLSADQVIIDIQKIEHNLAGTGSSVAGTFFVL